MDVHNYLPPIEILPFDAQEHAHGHITPITLTELFMPKHATVEYRYRIR
jgi:hypothetical protein